MTYSETLDYLFAQLPMYQRQGPKAFKKDLKNIQLLLKALGNPHEKLTAIHIAGTNGKGTVSHLIAAALQRAGLKTGLYTSPHYNDFRERIKIDGQKISKEEVVRFVQKNKGLIETIRPSFFEITVALAFLSFAERQTDIAVIEAGLGGRLDSTNIITPLLSVITNISYDHQNFLGNTLAQIAGEKAGIIKEGVPVVIGESKPETDRIFHLIAEEKNAPIYFADQIIQAQILEQNKDKLTILDIEESGHFYARLEVELQGPFVLNNVRTATMALTILEDMQALPTLVMPTLMMAWPELHKLTAYQGRWQWIGQNPDILCDSAHNEAALQAVLSALRQMEYKQLHIVLGMVFDKDSNRVLPLFPKDAQYYFCKPNVPRGLDALKLKKLAEKYQLHGNSYPSVKAALQAAKNKAQKEDLVFVGGSTFVVAEVV